MSDDLRQRAADLFAEVVEMGDEVDSYVFAQLVMADDEEQIRMSEEILQEAEQRRAQELKEAQQLAHEYQQNVSSAVSTTSSATINSFRREFEEAAWTGIDSAIDGYLSNVPDANIEDVTNMTRNVLNEMLRDFIYIEMYIDLQIKAKANRRPDEQKE